MAATLYLVDAHSLIFQVFHAIPEMSAPDGRPTNAVFGFSRDLLYLVEQKKPDYLICAFDAPGPVFRDEIYPDYKATRPPMPDNLRPQLDMIRHVVEAMRIPLLECPRYEADDIVATVVRWAAERGIDTFICTGDKDARQLLGPHVAVYNIRKDQVFDVATLRAEWGVGPEQVVDLLAMTGDTVDNVPGIAGIGPKTAAALLQEFGSLDGVLANVDRVSGKKRQENLRAGVESARRARELVRLRSDVPIELDWDAARTGRFDAPRLAGLFAEFGFRRLTAQFAEQSPASSEWRGNYHTVDDAAKLDGLAAELTNVRRVALEIQTTGQHPRECKIVGIALACKPGEAWYVPVRGPLAAKCVSEQDLWARLRPVLESAECEKVGHDLKRQSLVLRAAGVRLAGLALDTMVADYLMEAGERSHDWEQLARRYLEHPIQPSRELLGEGPQQLTFDRVPVDQATQYAGERADVALRVSDVQQPKLREQGLWQLYESVERPLIEVLAEMEWTGISIDVPLLERLSRRFAARLEEMETEIYRLAGEPFNIASPNQLRQILFEKLKLPVLKRTKTGPSTDQEVLEQLAPQHALPALLIEQRQIAKLKSTYVDALPQLVNPATGRVHASFNQVVAATGRLSSSDPNLQNIPIRSEQGRLIRQAFIPGEEASQATGSQQELFRTRSAGPDWKLLTADYSQIELRILAHFSGDTELCRAFADDQDIHSFVASQIYGARAQDVTTEMRRQAKTVNVGVVYGLSPFGLAARLGIPEEEAKAFIDAYFAKYSGVDAFIARVLEQAHRDGCVTTILGRRRRIAGVRPNPGRSLNQPEREAVNTVLQGSAADLIKMAMVNLHRRVRREGFRGRMLLQIHDELLFETPGDELARLADVVAAEMTGALALNVPLKVDVAAGPNWLDVEPIESVHPQQSQP